MTYTCDRVQIVLKNSQLKFKVILITESPESFGDAEIITQIGKLYFIFLRDRGQEFVLISKFPKLENAVYFDDVLKRLGVLDMENYDPSVSKFEDIWPVVFKYIGALKEYFSNNQQCSSP